MNRIELSSRRDFLNSIFSAGALIFAAGAEAAKATWNPSVFIGLDTDGSVTIIAHRSEMGTGIRTSLPMVVADEMEADWSRVRVEQALGDLKYGSQNTDGSCSIRDFYDIMRDTGATARLMLERAAGDQWKVSASECKARNHEVVHTPSGRKIGFGALASAAAKQPLPRKEEVQLKTAAEFRP